MSFYIGIDGGGTKTECAVVDRSGRLIANAAAGPSNPLRIGFDAAFRALEEAAQKALARTRIRPAQIAAVCAGLAGAGRPRVARRAHVHLSSLFPRARVQVTTDFEIALRPAVGSRPGVVLVAGTGSVAFGCNARGRAARAGGWGRWISDEGSAFSIGRQVVAAVARQREGLGLKTMLATKLLRAVGCRDWNALTERMASNPDNVFPRLFPLVADAANAGDIVAREILAEAAVALSRLAVSVIYRLRLAGKEFTLVKAGGVFGRTRWLDRPLDVLIAGVAPRVRIVRLTDSPALGAARLARQLTRGRPRSRRAH